MTSYAVDPSSTRQDPDPPTGSTRTTWRLSSCCTAGSMLGFRWSQEAQVATHSAASASVVTTRSTSETWPSSGVRLTLTSDWPGSVRGTPKSCFAPLSESTWYPAEVSSGMFWRAPLVGLYLRGTIYVGPATWDHLRGTIYVGLRLVPLPPKCVSAPCLLRASLCLHCLPSSGKRPAAPWPPEKAKALRNPFPGPCHSTYAFSVAILCPHASPHIHVQTITRDRPPFLAHGACVCAR